MKTSPLYLFFCTFWLLLLISACGPSRPELIQIDPAFSKYVSGYTSGIIDRDESVRIELAEPSEQLMDLSESELKSLFECEPHIDGKVHVINDRIVEFVPEDHLPVKQFYTIRFNLGKICSVEESKCKEFAFQFATGNQEMEVELNSPEFYNNYHVNYMWLQGSIRLSQEEDSLLIKKSIRATFNGQPIRIRFTDHYYHSSEFVIDSIPRSSKQGKLVVQWDGSILNSISNGSEEFTIRALGDFNVTNVETFQQDEQQLNIAFSEPIDSYQQLEGLITLKGVSQLTYTVNRNIVSVFLPKRYEGTYRLHVHPGIKNVAGHAMKNDYEEDIYLREAYPLVRIPGNGGTILPNSQGLIFPFEAIALKSVTVRIIQIYEKNVHYFLQVNELNGEDELTRFGKIIAEKKIKLKKDGNINLKQWNSHVINLEELIKTEPGAIYQVAIKFDQSDALCDCPDSEEQTFHPEEGDPDDDNWNEAYWHSYGFNGYSTWSYYDDESTEPCQYDYYYGKAITRNILASNIGMIFKLDEDKTSHAFLSDMVTTQPIGQATVSYYDYTKNLIATVTTDATGMASVKLKEKPFLMIASKGTQRGYMKLTDGHTNSLSKFDVSGEMVQHGVKGFIYGDRGVWRPGDSLFITFMLQDKLGHLPANHPVKFELYDPMGNIIFQQSKTKHVNRVYDFRTATSAEAPTGNYEGRVHVGNKVFREYFKVETVKPNRLKVALEVEKKGDKDSCTLVAKWLHGASAADLNATVSVHLSPMKTSFKDYKGFHFDSPIRRASSDNKVVFSGKLDQKGQARFANNYQNMTDAAGMLQANYITKVFEKSGNFSIDRKVASFSPFKRYVGIRAPEGSKYDHTLETDKKHQFELVSLQADGRLAGKHELQVQVYKLDWSWWYDGEDQTITDFTARSNAILIREQTVWTYNGKAHFDLDVRYPDYGRFLILVTDQEGRHQTGQIVRVDWPYWNRGNRSENEFASMLTFNLNKEKYVKGEMIQLSFPSPSDGRALISVETSQKVIKKFWIETKKGETFHSFEATADMAPNAFIHVTLLQPHHATKNDLPIRMYGVMPVSVDDPETHLHPLIQVADELRPESKATITVKEEKGQKMTYTLAIVDDGLLDLTNFRTPQPWNTFYAKEALGVRTWDMYDYVIGAYGGKMENLYSIGGDAGNLAGKGLKANRFEPMVRFIGPFELGAGKSATHQIDIPNYVGSVRVMVVARDEEAYGNAQKTVVIKKPLMLLATLPRVLSPQEEFSLPVDVFAMEKHIKNVQIKLEANDALELLDSPSKSVQFQSEGDQIVNFKFKVRNKLGIGKIKIRATSGNETATQELEIDIRPQNPVEFSTQTFEVAPGKSVQATLDMDGISGTNLGTIELSTLPAINLEKRLEYLIAYPHGCLEQTTSSVFPQLYLSQLSILTKDQEKAVNEHIKAGIRRLQLFQNSNGSFSYWPGESYANEWGTNYAGHFLLEAENRGYSLPVRMKERWIAFQREQAQQWSGKNNGSALQRAEDLTQAYRLYLLALANQPEIGAMNRLREQKQLSDAAKWRLACAYYLIGQKEVAAALSSSAGTEPPRYRELSETFGSQFRDKALILESMSLLHQHSKAGNFIQSVARTLSSEDWLSTQETAYGLLAVARYVGNGQAGAVSNAQLGGDLSGTVEVNRKIERRYVQEKSGKQKQQVSIKNTGQSTIYATVTTRKVRVPGQEKQVQSGLQLSVSYTDFGGTPLSVDKLKQGSEFLAVVKLTNPSKTEYYREMSLEHLFPSGWEVHNTRLFGGAQGTGPGPRYQDVRDDRVYSYFDLAPGKSITITVQLNATYLGKYYLPAVRSEAMYDHRIHAQVPGRWIRVE